MPKTSQNQNFLALEKELAQINTDTNRLNERKREIIAIFIETRNRLDQAILEGGVTSLTQDSSIEVLELIHRTSNCLKAAGILTVGKLTERTEGELFRTPNLGRKSLNELKEVLKSHGLKLKEPTTD